MSKKYLAWLTILPVMFVVLCVACRTSHSGNNAHTTISCSRIISFAPGTTEMLYALSLGDSVVGVSDFCKYPPQAATKPKIGGNTNPNYEMILRLKPTLAVLLKEQSTMQDFLNKKHIPYIMIDNSTMASIFASMHNLGKQCNRERAADSIIASIRSAVVTDIDTGRRLRVLLCIDRESPGGNRIASVYAAGKATFYNDLIEAAGMTNAIVDSSAVYPQLSTEGLVRLQPDIIIDIAMRSLPVPKERVRADWQMLPVLHAVKNDHVAILSGAYLTIPGPRIGMILKEFNAVRLEYCAHTVSR
jgi:iron complex transport system substrate-binding protein